MSVSGAVGCVYMRNFNPGRVQPGLKVSKEVSVYMKTVDPGQILICRQKFTSTVLHGHVNPFARNLHLQFLFFCTHIIKKSWHL